MSRKNIFVWNISENMVSEYIGNVVRRRDILRASTNEIRQGGCWVTHRYEYQHDIQQLLSLFLGKRSRNNSVLLVKEARVRWLFLYRHYLLCFLDSATCSQIVTVVEPNCRPPLLGLSTSLLNMGRGPVHLWLLLPKAWAFVGSNMQVNLFYGAEKYKNYFLLSV